jgi:hypothetical protein
MQSASTLFSTINVERPAWLLLGHPTAKPHLRAYVEALLMLVAVHNKLGSRHIDVADLSETWRDDVGGAWGSGRVADPALLNHSLCVIPFLDSAPQMKK